MNDFITKKIKTLASNVTVRVAQQLCEQNRSSHVIIENEVLVGAISYEELTEISEKEAALDDYSYLFQYFCVDSTATVLEIINLFVTNDCTILPVVNQEKECIGVYELSKVLEFYTESPFFHIDNKTLIVEKDKADFSMSKIAQIVESNNAKVTGQFIYQETGEAIQVLVQVLAEDLNEIIQTFRRYDYHVVTEHIDDEYLEELKDRANYFKHYIDI